MTSKELSLSLLEIEKHLKDFVFHFEMGKVDKMFISNSFEIIEKALKAFEIIKKKEVNIQELFDFIKKYGKHNGLYMYNGHRPYEKRINEEQFDLLAEVLKYGKL